MGKQDWQLVVWGIVAAAALAVEMLTLALLALYVFLGALVAMVVVLADGNLTVQLLAFAAGSLLLLAFTRPLFMRRLQKPHIHSNVNALEGRTGIVTVPIDNHRSTGQIRVGTEYWTARNVDDDAPAIPVESQVVVREVTGVTARVELRELSAPAGGAAHD